MHGRGVVENSLDGDRVDDRMVTKQTAEKQFPQLQPTGGEHGCRDALGTRLRNTAQNGSRQKAFKSLARNRAVDAATAPVPGCDAQTRLDNRLRQQGWNDRRECRPIIAFDKILDAQEEPDVSRDAREVRGRIIHIGRERARNSTQ